MSDDQQDQTAQRDAAEQDQHDDAPDTDLGEKGKAAIDAERKARRDAEKRAKDAEKRLADLEAAERKRTEAEATAQGKWQELAEKREADLTAATESLTSTQERLDAALKVITATVAASWKDVPEEIQALYDGPDDDPLAKQTFLAKPATQKLIERLADKPSARGNGPNPDPSDGTRDINKAIETAKANPKYSF